MQNNFYIKFCILLVTLKGIDMKRFATALISAIIGLMLWGAASVYAQDVHVHNEEELQAAFEQKASEIYLESDIALSATMQVRDYTGVIHGNNHRIYADANLTNMFLFEHTTLTVDRVELDALNRARHATIAHDSTVTFDESTIKRGNSGYDTTHSEGGSFYVIGSNLSLRNSSVTQSQSHKHVDAPEDTSPHGGAIYAINSTLNLDTCEVTSNMVGSGVGHGGALYVERTRLTIAGSHFAENKLHTKVVITGASIYAGDNAEVTIDTNAQGKRTKFDIIGPFNTGGALRLLDANATINNTDFLVMASNGDAYATTGAALCMEGSGAVVKNSTFKFENPSSNKAKLEFAGGFIAVIGEIKQLDIQDSVFEGRGKGNGLSTANYGGAICFESLSQNPRYTWGNATISRTTFNNFNADAFGGTIALSTKPNEHNEVTLTLNDCAISNTGTLFWGGHYGGGVAVGPGNTLIMRHSSIRNATSWYGGGIYNQGSVQLLDGSVVSGNLGYSLGGGVYNDGELLVGDARFENNVKGDWSTGPYHDETRDKPTKEFSGASIYAHKDVTFTPAARFDGQDVRVIPGISKIILTGSRPTVVPVSIAEGNTSEGAHRAVGAVIAAGKDYTVTPEDAKALHYVSADTSQPVALQDDHVSLATWDALANPRNNTVVIGQRMNITYHANADGQDDEKHAWFKLDDGSLPATYSHIQDVYAPDLMLSDLTFIEPLRSGFYRMNWYTRAVTDQEVSAAPDQDVVTYLLPVRDEITRPIDPASLDVYAGWKKNPSLESTTVSHQGVSATADKPLQLSYTADELQSAVTLEDEVRLKDLKPNAHYRLVTVINKIEGDTVIPVKTIVGTDIIESNTADKNHTVQFSIDASFIDFDTTYVVYEYLFPADEKLNTSNETIGIDERDKALLIAAHTDPSAHAQMFAVSEKTYKPVTVELQVKKELQGRSFAVDDLFTFTLAPQGDDTPRPDVLDVDVHNGDIQKFEGITFTKPGTYRYVISEVLGNDAHITYDENTVTATVRVSVQGDGLVAEVSYDNGKDSAVFTNLYPTLKTLVSVGLMSATPATATTPAQPLNVDPVGMKQVKDEVFYSNLKPHDSYRLKSTLVRVLPNGYDYEIVRTLSMDFVPTTADGSITVDFGEMNLKDASKYVVFEELNFTYVAEDEERLAAEEDNVRFRLIALAPPEWIVHKDLKDDAQTFITDALVPDPINPVDPVDPIDPDPVLPDPIIPDEPTPDPAPIPEPTPDPDPTPVPDQPTHVDPKLEPKAPSSQRPMIPKTGEEVLYGVFVGMGMLMTGFSAVGIFEKRNMRR